MKNPVDKERECSVEICDGKQLLVFPSYETNEAGCDYVRFVDAETDEELLYYNFDEWRDDPQLVMGCIMAAIQNGAMVVPVKAQPIKDAFDNTDSFMSLTTQENGVTVKVEWSDLNEGINGDYDPDDPDDIHLLRFDVSATEKHGRVFEPVDDASYCTQVPAGTPSEILDKGLELIMSKVLEPLSKGKSIKKICEKISWLDVDAIERGEL